MSSYVELETRTKIKGTNEKYVIKIDREDRQYITYMNGKYIDSHIGDYYG